MSCIFVLAVAYPCYAAQGFPHPDRTFVPTQHDLVYVADLQQRLFHGFMRRTEQGKQFYLETAQTSQGKTQYICTACLGYQLVFYGIGAQRHYLTRTQAQTASLTILRALYHLPQNASEHDSAGYKGFYYHALDAKTGRRADIDNNVIDVTDNAILMMGVLFSRQFYLQDTAGDDEIRRLADQLFERVEWPFMRRDDQLLAQSWSPSQGLSEAPLQGYNESLMSYLLGLGSPTHPLERVSWLRWSQSARVSWARFFGEQYLNAVPLYAHLLTQGWIDFHGIEDDMNRDFHCDYACNSYRAIVAQQEYGRRNPLGWKNYGDIFWALTLSDGPSGDVGNIPSRHFLGRALRGVSHDDVIDDGTISPAIVAASLPFAPQIILPTLHAIHAYYGRDFDGEEGLVDSVNFTQSAATNAKSPWISHQWHLQTQGLATMMIENWRDHFIWNVMKLSPVICRGLIKAGFRGGWLDKHHLTVDYDDARRARAH